MSRCFSVFRLLAPAALAALVGGCGSDSAPSSEGEGSALVPVGDDPASAIYPDVAALYEQGLAPTCALNQGVCHGGKQYPDLSSAEAFLDVVEAPCQLGIPDPQRTLGACETPGDRLVMGGIDNEIAHVLVLGQAVPARGVQLRLARALDPFQPAGARIRRVVEDGKEVLSVSLEGASIHAIPGYPAWVQLNFEPETDPDLARFLDTRVWDGDRVRQGDPNDDGKAHAAASPWALVVPGAPSRSMLYQRLLTDTYGAAMPLVTRTWSAAATRAVYCWIRGMPAGATPGALAPDDRIDYAGCPLDASAPVADPLAGFPAVSKLFAARCSTFPCHSAETHAGSLDLTPDAATLAKTLVGVPSDQQPGALRVAPGQPAASYLLCKVDPSCEGRAVGTAVMPSSGELLTETELKTISDWIAQGSALE